MAVTGDAAQVMDPTAMTKKPTKARRKAATATTARHLAGPYGASFTGEGARGLTFERRWTTPGVHPYDEITWEYRTAGIANESGKSRLRAEGRRGPRRSGASSPPTSWSASTSAATSARRSARPPSAS